MQAGRGRGGAGCYKCGKTGHWSRDCTVPPSEWIKRPETDQAFGAQGQTRGTDAPLQGTPAAAPDLAPAKKKRPPKPKLTFELLKGHKYGLDYVYTNFADDFRKRFKGKGHEAGDLQRLLDMYVSWQQLVFPHTNFDEFLESVEKIGKSHEVKKELRELRMMALDPLERLERSRGGPTDPARGGIEGLPGEGGSMELDAPDFDIEDQQEAAAAAAAAAPDETDDFDVLEDVERPEAGEDDVMDDLLDEFDA